MDSEKQEQNLAIREVADCKCGAGKVRIHAIEFKHGDVVKYYADCIACGRVTGWHESEEKALAEMESLEAA